MMTRHKKYLCKIKWRRDFHGRRLSKRLRQMDGVTVQLHAYVLLDGESEYAGEWGLYPHLDEGKEFFGQAGITWIPSGDVEVIEEVMKKQLSLF